MKIGIIGAGASGMAAALAAAQQPGAKVTVLERQARVGRKLQATGNGRCNLSNLHAAEGGFHGDHPEFSRRAIAQFPPEQTLQWFRGMGLFTVAEPSGRVYPYSDQANSVVDVLRFAMEHNGVRLIPDCEVSRIRRQGAGFLVEGKEQKLEFDRVIVACGGLAGTKLGGTMAGYRLLRALGHHCGKLRPALVQVKTGWHGISGLKGVRANCRAAIYCDGQLHRESSGEIQFTDFGLSGPVMYEITRDACQGGGEWECRLDFLPQISEAELRQELLRRMETELTTDDLLTGILHNRLGRVLCQNAGIRSRYPIAELTGEEIDEVCCSVKEFSVSLTELLGMDAAQVTAGGIDTDEFDPDTMESRLVPGLYACGEVLDVDGDCGGYNLQWAWSSGRMAGLHAGKESLYD